ncbi:hypothetical protein Vretimale_14202 [Volvox reticuliferus]|uniref:ABC transporter domain-containing protein n=1 Tax=Volvox reticuliferus TaxID=1737510 RepID=A0A8J4GP20_9CHLO|nr:hypothetical protein Vretifemale_15100 [Volvox reticuliferus]GIM10543.1 hypothetical protein Vretimale_14202 [Volvox reticuliferus]
MSDSLDFGPTPDKTGGAHIAIAVKDGTKVLQSDLKRAAENSGFKRVQTSANILQTIDKRAQVVIRFESLCAWVPTLVVPGGQGRRSSLMSCVGTPREEGAAKPQAPKERQILFNVTGEVNPGEVLALMGPSGGGKTSLLTLLGGRSTARLEGNVTFNGARMSKPLKRKLGYVMQDDLLFAELTVYETLYFAALLRLPRSWSRADKLARVDLVIEGLGLERCRDTIIGSHMMRGVSGGERKRVSIGHELLINPSMLLLDEPTSGLDSTTALRLMHTLRSLASGGRTIVTSIHQPSSRLYHQMDKLMLLAQGHLMYYGDAQCVAVWFKMLGQPCPFGTNIADHILDLANGDVATRSGGSVASGLSGMGHGGGGAVRRRGAAAMTTGVDDMADDGRMDDRALGGGDDAAAACPSRMEDSAEEIHRQLIEAYEKRTIGRGRGGIRASELQDEMAEDVAAPGGGGRGASSLPSGDGARGGIVDVDLQKLASSADAEDKWGAPWVQQVRYLAVRSIKTRRFQSLSVQKTAQLLVVAVLGGLFWWQIGVRLDSTQAVLDVGGLLFFVELFMGFSTLFAALFTFPLEFQMLVKERQSGMYRLSAYYLARTASDLPMDCFLPSLFVWIIYWMAGLRIDAGAFFAHWASVLLIVLTSQSVGLLIGATVINPQNGQTIATIFMLATMLVGGYYVRGMPVWIAWLKYVSFIYWGWNLLLKIEFRHRPYDCGLVAGAAAGAKNCSVKQADIFDINVDAPVTKEVCILIAMLIFLRLVIYYALKHKTTFKGHK